MWDFLNLKGVVRKDGSNVESQPLTNWIFVMGYPISEPYWARVKIGGIYQDALFQMYERRSLAYVPALPKGWQVQMGNVGGHYYRWIYGGPLPEPLVAQTKAVPTAVAQLPPAVDAEISPQVASVGTPLSVALSGMRPSEGIVSWFTAPDGEATGVPFNLTAGPDGKVQNISISTIGMSPGQWAVTYHGKASGHESIAYFLLTTGSAATVTPTRTRTAIAGTPRTTPVSTATRPRATATRPPPPRGSATPTPTFPVVPTQPAGGFVVSVDPGYGPPNAQFTFSARGLRPGETAQIKFTTPDGSVVYPNGSNGQYTVNSAGRLALELQPDTAFPSAPLGIWLFEVDGLSSGLQGVVGFTLR
jgi:hypothetical protein